jgi:hypothetical protein
MGSTLLMCVIDCNFVERASQRSTRKDNTARTAPINDASIMMYNAAWRRYSISGSISTRGFADLRGTRAIRAVLLLEQRSLYALFGILANLHVRPD